MISRREAKELVDWVVQEIMRRRFPYVTDGRLDLSKSPVGTISGTQTSGGPIADSAIYDRHVAPNADIRGTKVRVATTAERGTVQLGTEGEALVPTMSGLRSTISGLGASLIGIYDAEEDFVSDDVEATLHELVAIIEALTFLDLVDTPANYANRFPQVPTVTETEAGLEWRPVDYYDGEDIAEAYSGSVPVRRGEEIADGESATVHNILDGGEADDYLPVYGRPNVRIGSKDQIAKGNYTQIDEHGCITLHGTAMTTIELRPDIDFESVRANGKPTWVTRGVVGGFSLPVYSNDNEELFSSVHVPYRWCGNHDIEVHVEGYLDTANTGKKFQLRLEWENVTCGVDVVPATSNTVNLETDTGVAVQYESFQIDFAVDYDIDGVGNEIGAEDCLFLRIYRIAASSDEIAGEFVITHVGVRFERDKLGLN